jgi:protein gp37
MGKDTAIGWADHTWNPWTGCRKVAQGCKNCYADTDHQRFGLDFGIIIKSKTRFDQPLKLPPGTVFTCSWSDFFIEEADEWRDEAWEIIAKCPQNTFLILTKRPERVFNHLPFDDDGRKHVPSNCWIGVSAATHEELLYMDRVMDNLHEELFYEGVDRMGRTFISIEPLIEDVVIDQQSIDAIRSFDWVLVGGESGKTSKARPCRWGWVVKIVEVCEGNTPIFVKQLGVHLAKEIGDAVLNANGTNWYNSESLTAGLPEAMQFPNFTSRP